MAMRSTPHLQLNTRINTDIGTRLYAELARRRMAGQPLKVRAAVEQAIECWLNMAELGREYAPAEHSHNKEGDHAQSV